jgi:hypothetical protein
MRINHIQIFIILSLTVINISTQENNPITIRSQDEYDNKNNQKNINEDKTIISTISHDELDKDGYTINKNQVIINSDFNFNEDKHIIMPEAQVILPIRRRDTSKAVLNAAPCGGVTKRKADTLMNMGKSVYVIWETIMPIAGGNCTVKLSPGLELEQNFTTLKPLDSKLDNDGAFACGRVKGFESHEFALPEDYVCDQCTLQWTWKTSVGNFYSCSDIIINGNKIENCIAKCQNGGACFNGKCLCGDSFYGDFCQHNSN